MGPILAVLALVALTLTACENRPPPSPERPEPPPASKVSAEKERVESLLPSEVKIRLKRDGKDNYSWELSGSDVDQIIKVDEKLRKKVGGHQAK